MGKSSTPATQTVTNTTTLPDWVNSAAQDNLATAKTDAQNLAQPYSGQTVAQTNSDTNDAYALTRAASGLSQAGQSYAQNTLNNAQNYQGQQITAGTLANTDLSSYMNPYTQDVINASAATGQQALQQGYRATGDAAASAGAFGGSRQGVAEGSANAQNAINQQNYAATQNAANFTQAQGAATTDLNRQLTAAQSNQAASQAAQNSDITAAQAGSANATAQQNSALQSASTLQSVGTAEQAQDQANIDAQVNYYNAQAQYPLEQLAIQQSALSSTPYGETKTSTGPAQTQGSSGLLQGLGAAGTLASSLFSLSDRTMKTDITKLGKDPHTGVDMHAYRYKGDPKNSPKIVSAMAQDVEKKFPGSTKKIGGKMAVDASKLPNGVAQRLGFGGGPVAPTGQGGLLAGPPAAANVNLKVGPSKKAKGKH